MLRAYCPNIYTVRKGYKGGGCDGSVGGSSYHQCVLKPTGDEIKPGQCFWDLKSCRDARPNDAFFFTFFPFLNSSAFLH